MRIIDDLFEPARGAASAETQSVRGDWETTLAELLDCGIESLSSLAAFEIGRLRLGGLREHLATLSPHSALQTEIILDALEQLDARGKQTDG